MIIKSVVKVIGIVPMLFVGLASAQIGPQASQNSEANVHTSSDKLSQKDEDCTSTIKKTKYKLKTTYRFQNLFVADYNVVDGQDFESSAISTNMLVRRARIKIGGSPLDNFKYKMEIGLSNNDHGGILPQTNKASRMILDAYVVYTLPKAKNFSIKVGQMKLAGNRERVISSQQLQFVDRSLLNSKYNIDRDIAIQAQHSNTFTSGALLKSSFSLAQGEGRNITTGNEGGYEYTARLEFLPFGKFHETTSIGGKRVLVAGKGDYISAAIVNEKCPKLALGLSYDQNNNAVRKNGNTKEYMDGYRTLSTIFADLIFKYNRLSIMAEYTNKSAPEGSVLSMDSLGRPTANFYTGKGINIQSGYIFKRNGSDLGKGLSEIAVRFTKIMPDKANAIDDISMYTLGFSRYVDKHNIKVQTDVSLTQKGDSDPTVMYRIQLEMALSGFKIKK
jgi:phosphate-selective porin OprO and OprP